MKLFDYKFLILLALTLVVYFIFREVLDLRKKIEALQNNIDNMSNKMLEDKNKSNVSTGNNSNTNKPVAFQIPLPKKNVQVSPPNEEQCLVEVPKLIHNKLSTIDESQNVSETESVADSNNEERLAIYSNDNHEDVVEEFSLDETSDLNTADIINNISDNESSVNSKENGSPKKKKNLLVEIEGNDVNEDILDDINLYEIKHTITTLMKLKLNELQCLAEENSIEIVNSNKNRKKTKTELSNELLEHFKTA